MFPRNHKKTLFKQQGFLLPLALFILVVMGVLALTISRTATQTNMASIQEIMNVQAFYAAESGAQRGMKHLFFDSTQPPTRTSVDSQCSNLSTIYNFTADGLKACNAEVNCAFTKDGDDIRSFYTITSTGRCGEDQYRAERTIEVGSFMMEQE